MSAINPQRLPLTRPVRRFDRALWTRRLLNVGFALLVGFILGQQIYHPQPRILKSIIGIAVLYAGWKFPIPVSLSAFLVLFPYPFAIAYGSSNTIFIFLITAMWLAQIVLRTETAASRTMLDLPILFLMGAYLLSFSGVENAEALAGGLINLSTIVAGVFVYYLIVHSIRDEKTLRRTVNIIMIMILSTFVIALFELAFPGRAFIKGWILTSGILYTHGVEKGLRVGGPFADFELYAEFCAMAFPLMLFHLFRAKLLRSRVLWGLLTFLNLFVLMATVTRGATLSLLVGMTYLLWSLRKSLNFKQLTMTLAVTGSIVFAIEFYLSNYTVSGSVFERLMNTKIVKGLPDSRTFWPQIIERIKQKPWVGHGPFYEFGEYGQEKLRRFFWPHNGYLYYLHTVGILGTSAFLWILGSLWYNSKKRSLASLTAEDYSRSLLLVWNVMLVIFAADQLKIEYLRNQHYQFWPWIVFGMTVATLNVVRSRNPVPAVSRAERFRLFRRGMGENPLTAGDPGLANSPRPGRPDGR